MFLLFLVFRNRVKCELFHLENTFSFCPPPAGLHQRLRRLQPPHRVGGGFHLCEPRHIRRGGHDQIARTKGEDLYE